MGYALNHISFGAFTGQSSGAAAKPGLPSNFLYRFYTAFMRARQRQADREIDRYFARSGSVLTDGVEREMMQRAVANNWTARR